MLVNGAGAVYLDRGDGLERSDVRFPDEAAVRRLAQRLAAQGGRRLDDATPYVDLRLADGTRFHAVLAPLARPGTLDLACGCRAAAGSPSTSWSRRGTVHPDLGAAVAPGRLPPGWRSSSPAAPARARPRCWPRCSGEVDADERMVVVEDASELRPDHPHVVALEARPANIEGAGAVELRTLVRQALRMRPDRLVVGEVRGGEVVELLAALNTGHEGGCGTLHANSALDVPARVEALALAAGLGRVRPRTASSRPPSTWCSTSPGAATDAVGSRRWRCPSASAADWSRWWSRCEVGASAAARARSGVAALRAVLGAAARPRDRLSDGSRAWLAAASAALAAALATRAPPRTRIDPATPPGSCAWWHVGAARRRGAARFTAGCSCWRR